MKIKLNYSKRRKLIERIGSAEESIFALAKEFGVSRTLVYRIRGRYEQSEDLLLPGARRKRKPYLPVDIEGQIIDLALSYPELSSWKLAELIKGRIKLGHHGLYNLLKRFGLTRYETRKRLSVNYLERNRFPVMDKGFLVHEKRGG
jgi:transposase